MSKLITIIAFLLTTAACRPEAKEEEKDKGGAKQPARSVAAVDLAPGKVLSMTAADLKVEMNAGHFETGGESDAEASSDCYAKIFRAAKWKATKETLLIDIELDFYPCLLESLRKTKGYESANFDGLHGTMRTAWSMKITCGGSDLSSYDGKPYEVDTMSDLCDDADSISILGESRMTSKWGGRITGLKTPEGRTADLEIDQESSVVTAQRMGDGSPCEAKVANGVFKWRTGCINTTRQVTLRNSFGDGPADPSDHLGEATFVRLEYEDVESKQGADRAWYAGGQMRVTFNDWSGTVTFTDADKAPTYVMKRGSEKITGRVQPASSNLLGVSLRTRAGVSGR